MPTRSYPSFYIYLDKAGEYRWRYQASGNHKTEADSAEGYKELRDCEAGIELVKRGASAPVFHAEEAAKPG